ADRLLVFAEVGFAELPVTVEELLHAVQVCRASYFIAALSISSSLERNWLVVIQRCSGPTRIARSLVMKPDSTACTQTFSSVSANFTTSGVPSNSPRYLRPRVQAKIDAIGFDEVSLPC